LLLSQAGKQAASGVLAGGTGDANGDGVVTFGDISAVLSTFGANCGP
jgi:hypothetical protein